MTAILNPPPKSAPFDGLALLRAINYDWTMHLRSVWTDPPYDAADIHARLRRDFQLRLDELKQDSSSNAPLGWLVVGAAGSGKTHWLSICRQQAVAREMGFVLVDMTDVRSFWSTVLQGFLDSLQQEYTAGEFQQQVLLRKFLKLFQFNVTAERALQLLPTMPGAKLAEMIGKVVAVVRKRHPVEALQHQDVIRAILATNSNDAAIAAAGLSWLNANQVDDGMRSMLAFTKAQEEPIRIVKALSWMMSLCGPTVLAFDQLDPIVAQLDPAAQSQQLDAQGQTALAIIQEIANGMGAMFDTTYRTLTVVSCLDATLELLKRHTLKSWRDRFLEPRELATISSAEAAVSILHPRVAAACRKVGAAMPSQIWPLASTALDHIGGLSPRELLRLCNAHKERCLRNDAVEELSALQWERRETPAPMTANRGLDLEFERLRRSAEVAKLLHEATDDEELASLLIAGCRCLLHELELPPQFDAIVDDFPGGRSTKPLHARIRLIDHGANDREEHFCVRGLERQNATAFQARLRGAMNGSGIDRRLPFRHAILLRSQRLPGGEITHRLVSEYEALGGLWHHPSEDEIRTLFALRELISANAEGLEQWLQCNRPASKLRLFQRLCPRLFEVECLPGPTGENSAATVEPGAPTVEKVAFLQESDAKSTSGAEAHSCDETKIKAPACAAIAAAAPLPSTRDIPLGKRQIGSKTETVRLPLQLLEKHTVVLAGAGSGKTVLLKRIVEEAALEGIPSIVLDGANDLAALGDRWPQPPTEWSPDDAAQAERYHAEADVVHWTPGRESGNPLNLEPLPDLAGVAADPEALEMAIGAAVDALAAMACVGKGAAGDKKRGVLSASLRFFASRGGGDLSDYIALLAELPPEAGLGIANEAKLAADLADAFLAKKETNPMLRGSGTGLNPAVLFGDVEKTAPGPRVSIISLIGLATTDLRQQFVYQLGMTLFAWIKRNPNPPSRPLRGLLVVDEARDFIPAVTSTPSKISLQLLASQARKYHLGLVLATQNPREIENKIIGNCATHFYGRASSPTSIQVIQEQLQMRGGKGDDIAALKAGQFYAYNSEAGLAQPARLATPMCLSWHHTLEEAEVMALAAHSRERLRR
jgi:hypothetical protein